MNPQDTTSDKSGSRIQAILIGMLPVFAILSLGGYMASSQASSRNTLMQAVPEFQSLADASASPNETVLMFNGRLAALDTAADTTSGTILGNQEMGEAADWLVYHEHLEGSRTSREQAAESMEFPPLRLVLPDGELRIEPVEEGRMIHSELHSETLDGLVRSGFRSGDRVTVQGVWMAEAEGEPASLVESTGISGMSKAELIQETQVAARKVTTFSRVTGVFAFLGLLALLRSRKGLSSGRRASARPGAQRA